MPTTLVELTAAAIRSVRVSDRVGLVALPRREDLRPRTRSTRSGRERVLLTWDLIRSLGLDVLPNVERLTSEHPADDATIELVHTPDVRGGDAPGRRR